jgi:hypothetical protein
MEHYTEQHCRTVANAHGGVLLKLSPFGIAGIPDRLLLMPGAKLVFIEFKAPGKYPTPLQRHWHERLRKLGFRVEVYRSSAEFRALVDELKTV